MALVVVGIQKHRWNNITDLAGKLEAAESQLAPIGAETGLDIVPVATNIRDLNPATAFWQYEFQGAALAGIGHLFADSLRSVSIASTWSIGHLRNWGSHPLLDPNFGTDSLSIWHELAHLSRLDKLKIISNRPTLLQLLNVCNGRTENDSNCGRCEKCIRTMLGLEALGLLARNDAFSRASLTPADLRAIRIGHPGIESEYLELIDPLRGIGRNDLASKIGRLVHLNRIQRRLRAGFARSLVRPISQVRRHTRRDSGVPSPM